MIEELNQLLKNFYLQTDNTIKGCENLNTFIENYIYQLETIQKANNNIQIYIKDNTNKLKLQKTKQSINQRSI